MKNQNQLKQEGITTYSEVDFKKKNELNCLILCKLDVPEEKFEEQIKDISEYSTRIGYESFVTVNHDCLNIKVKIKNENKFCFQQLMEDNPVFSSVIFQRLSHFLIYRSIKDQYLIWFKKHRIQVHFFDKKVDMFNENFEFTDNFKSLLN